MLESRNIITTWAIWKVTSGELLTKWAMRKKNYYIQKICEYLSCFSTYSPPELRHLSYWGIIFLYTCVKEAWHLWAQPHFDTSHQLLIIAEAPWSQPVLQVGKQVVVDQSEVRAVWRVVRQLPVEMLQHCSSVIICTHMRMCIVMEEQ
jgi:hypothetical protein